MNPNHYTPSGKYSQSIFPYSLFLIFIGIPLITILYSLLIWYIPIIYFNLLLTLGLGFGVSILLNIVLRKGKVRNTKIAKTLAFIVAIFTIYFVWTTYLTLLFNTGETFSTGDSSSRKGGISLTETFFSIQDFVKISITPKVVPSAMSKLYETGTWGIRAFTVKGVILAIVWIIEASIIFIIVIIAGTKQSMDPFSERTNEWFDEKVVDHKFKLPFDIEERLESFKNGNYDFLESLEIIDGTQSDYLSLTKYSHDKEDTAYLNFSKNNVTIDENEKISTETKEMEKYLFVSKQYLENILLKFQ